MRKPVLMAIGALFMTALMLSPASATIVLKCGTSTQPTHIYNQAVEYFEKVVEKNSNGEIDVQLFPAAQLGSERDMVEGLQLGTLEMTLTSTGPLGNFIPQVKLFNLPFLFKDRETCYAVLDGKIGTDIADLFPRVGVRSLGWYENGFRNVTNSKRPINAPADMDGLKIRVMEDDVFILTMKALGASPLPMAFGELYTAPAMLLISEITWQTLSPKHQKIISDAATEAKAYERKISMEADQQLEAECQKAGMVVTHPDKAPFVAAVAGVYDNPSVIKAIGGGNLAEGKKLIDAARAASK